MAVNASDIVISYRSIKDLAWHGLQQMQSGVELPVGGSAEQVAHAGMVTPEDVEHALILFEKAANDPRAPKEQDILIALDDRVLSLLQSSFAEFAIETKSTLIPLPNGGYEPQFDQGDLIGWAKSLRDHRHPQR